MKFSFEEGGENIKQYESFQVKIKLIVGGIEFRQTEKIIYTQHYSI